MTFHLGRRCTTTTDSGGNRVSGKRFMLSCGKGFAYKLAMIQHPQRELLTANQSKRQKQADLVAMMVGRK